MCCVSGGIGAQQQQQRRETGGYHHTNGGLPGHVGWVCVLHLKAITKQEGMVSLSVKNAHGMSRSITEPVDLTSHFPCFPFLPSFSLPFSLILGDEEESSVYSSLFS